MVRKKVAAVITETPMIRDVGRSRKNRSWEGVLDALLAPLEGANMPKSRLRLMSGCHPKQFELIFNFAQENGLVDYVENPSGVGRFATLTPKGRNYIRLRTEALRMLNLTFPQSSKRLNVPAASSSSSVA